jgi:predicted dithiol-disulfide oxidoreductase (DUF899 family)
MPAGWLAAAAHADRAAPARIRAGWSGPARRYGNRAAFVRDGERIYRTHFVNSRGAEALGSTWSYLDITALGRQEAWEDSPEGYPQTPPYGWWNYHNAYGKTP